MLRKILIILGLIAFDIGLIMLSLLEEPSAYPISPQLSKISEIIKLILDYPPTGIPLLVTPLVIALGLFVLLIYQHFIRERRIRILLLNFAILIFTPVLFGVGMGAFRMYFLNQSNIDVGGRTSTDQPLALHLAFYNEQGKQIGDLVIPVHGDWSGTKFYGGAFEEFAVTAELIAAPSGEILSKNVAFWPSEGIMTCCAGCSAICVGIIISESNGMFSIEFGDYI